MRSKVLFAAGVGLLGLAAGWLVGRQPFSVPNAPESAREQPTADRAEAKVPAMLPPRKVDPAFFDTPAIGAKVPVPLAKVETTSIEAAKFISLYDDKGVIYQKNTFTERSKDAYTDILDHTKSAGGSNVLLVHGEDFEQALLDTRRTLFSTQSADPVYIKPDADCWLFVSLGAGLWWERGVGPVRFDRRNRVVTFEYEPEGEYHGAPFRGYAYWVRLGQLQTGKYTLNLSPKGDDRPTLTRVVTLEEHGGGPGF